MSCIDDTRPPMPRKRTHQNATERQRAYLLRVRDGKAGIATRTNDPGQGANRLCVTLPVSTINTLKRLARYEGRTQADILLSLISSRVDEITRKMTDAESEAFWLWA